MSWTRPGKGKLDNPTDLILFNEAVDASVAALTAPHRVVDGCAVTPQTLLTLAVAKGAILSNGTLVPVAAGSAVIGTPHTTEPRLDMVVATAAGAIAVRAATAASIPTTPTLTAGDVPLALVYVTPLDTAITAPAIIDLRLMTGRGPCTIYRSAQVVTFNNSTALNTLLSITLPSGLLAADRLVRVRCGGTLLLNSGTPTVRIVIGYGGSTMFDDTSGAATADADRVVWTANLVLAGRSLTSQILNGTFWTSPLAAKTAPAAGQGDWVATQLLGPIRGGASVNSDLADRAFTIQCAMNVQNAANEVQMDYAFAELI